jgi:hypothetical protein
MPHRLLLTLLALVITAALAPAWWVKGHQAVTEAAAMNLPDDMPAFFRAAGKQLGHLAGDPDRWKNPDAKHLRAAEQPDHFLDSEDYDGNEWPEDRYKAARLLAGRLRKQPERTGMLPYSLMEHFDRLSVAFYDYRQVLEKEKKLAEMGDRASDAEKKAVEGEKKAIEMKCIVYAGVLSHYCGDTAMPLHTTIHYDGRMDKKGPDGKKLQLGIHAKIDGFPENNGFTPEEISRGLTAKEIPDVWKHIRESIMESFKHVDRCYELDAAGAIDKPTPDSREFIMQRCKVGAQFTMDLWYTAWKRSAKLPPSY